ncbi:MAG: MltA domain-containing protein [Methylobacteriaceae bacterium]|nr:MltA domain-containing protein [Methylobacteriaceae bacterium]
MSNSQVMPGLCAPRPAGPPPALAVGPGGARLERIAWERLAGFGEDNHRDAFRCFRAFCMARRQGRGPLRLGVAATAAFENRRPYTSVGSILIESGRIDPRAMSLTRLKAWLRDNRAEAREVMHRNQSYVFFRNEPGLRPDEGPLGGAGVPLTRLRPIAADRSPWPYGTPVFMDAELPWRSDWPEPFRRLMISEDRGLAILGPARADIFFGSGDVAGERAGHLGHAADLVVLLPVEATAAAP